MKFSFENGAPSLDGVALTRGSDFWRIHLDDGMTRELTVFSSDNAPASVTQSGPVTKISYDRLAAEDGRVFKEVSLDVFVTENADGSLSFRSEVENFGPVRVNEVQLPYLDVASLGADPSDEILYVPDGLGARYPDPRRYIAEHCHTEYMSADYNGIWMHLVYPSPLSMAWMGVEAAGRFLYIGRHDPELRLCTLSVGTSPREADEKSLRLAVSHYPAAQWGERIASPEIVVALTPGDWREGSRRYRAFADGCFSQTERPAWVSGLDGWQRVICKHQYGEIFFKYSDLPRVWRDGAKNGLNGLLVFGWWRGRFDNGYPHFEPDPDMGGAEALKSAIAEIQSEGGRVMLYTNGLLIDVRSRFYSKVGYRICRKDIDGNEYRDHYRFSNNGTLLRNFGYKSFVHACYSTPEWQERIVEHARLKLSFGADSVFFDQLGCLCSPCFDESHPHGARIDQDPAARVAAIEKIRAVLPSGKALGTEWVVDAIAARVHYIHGCGRAFSDSPEAYPALYRETFPETLASNRFIHDDKPGYLRGLYYAFVHGLIFDVSIYRGRREDIEHLPDYAAAIRHLTGLRARYRDYFLGKYKLVKAPSRESPLTAVRYAAPDGREIEAVWNGGDAPALWRSTILPPNDIAVTEV